MNKESIFKIWDSMGPSWKHTKYVGESFRTMDDYYTALTEYYGIEGGRVGLKNHIIDEVNQLLKTPEYKECDELEIRLYDIDLDKQVTSPMYMDGKYKGFGSKPFASYAFNSDYKGYECPDDVLHNDDWSPRDEVMHRNSIYNPEDMTPEMEEEINEVCFEEHCVYKTVQRASRFIDKKYGIGTNISTGYEEHMRGNIKIEKG